MNPITDLKKFLKRKTIAEAAEQLGVSRQTIYNWLSGKHTFKLANWQKILRKK